MYEIVHEDDNTYILYSVTGVVHCRSRYVGFAMTLQSMSCPCHKITSSHGETASALLFFHSILNSSVGISAKLWKVRLIIAHEIFILETKSCQSSQSFQEYRLFQYEKPWTWQWYLQYALEKGKLITFLMPLLFAVWMTLIDLKTKQNLWQTRQIIEN